MKTALFKWICACFLAAASAGRAADAPPEPPAPADPPAAAAPARTLRILSFNVLSGGAPVAEIGSASPLFRKPRHAEIAAVILESGADIVGVTEPPGATDPVLALLQAKDPAWQKRGGSNGRIPVFLYARFPITPDPLHPDDPTLHRVRIAPDRSVIVHVAHWWPAGGYGPSYIQQRMLAGDVPADPAAFEAQVLKKISIPETYRRTLEKVRPHLDARSPVFVLGDFNEPSHLDWTEAYAKAGADRWVGNGTGVPLRQKIAWAGSKTLADAGFKDAYRTVFPDPVRKPGNTWTPPYANGTPGRQPYDGAGKKVPAQALCRIDWILFAGDGVTATGAAVVGEDPKRPEHGGRSELVPELRHNGPWPSDHRAVLAVFRLTQEAGREQAGR